jgi:hypothetical protein
MATLRQIEANRRNAQKSTGPTSVTGKAAASMNALKTGLYAKGLLIPGEKLAELQKLIDEYYQFHQPTTPAARALLDDLIRSEWTLRRLDRAEAEMWPYQHNLPFQENQVYPLGDSATMHAASFSRIQYRFDTTRRARDRALKALQQLESVPAPTPQPAETTTEPLVARSPTAAPAITSPQIGFVPSTRPIGPLQLPPEAHLRAVPSKIRPSKPNVLA